MVLLSAPLLITMCVEMWRTPMPVSEAVALFEDVANQPPSRFLTPDTSYFRPFYQLSIGAIWRSDASVEAKLSAVKLMQIVPFALLVLLLIALCRPLTVVDAAAATVAVAVLLGSPGLRDNLEIPLSYTIVGMPLALMAWMLLTTERRIWHGAALILLTVVAVGFKEQGLILVALVTIAWMTRAPGASRWTVLALVVLVAAYVGYRLNWREKWPMFEQAVGLGFIEMEPPEAEERFGSFPYWVYAYNSAATMLNILFSEPTRGTFRIIRDIRNGHPQLWELNHLASAVALSGIIVWWGAGSLKRAIREGWSSESRVFMAMIVVVLSCGVLSFNYSRDRLGGMAAPFYALAAFYAVRAAAARVGSSSRPVLIGLALMLVAGMWQVRAISTMENVRLTSLRNQLMWLVELERRRLEFAERDTYLQIMESTLEQGIAQGAPRPTRYPRPIPEILALP